MKVQQQGPAAGPAVSRRDLFNLIHSKSATRDTLAEHVVAALQMQAAAPFVQAHVRREVSRFYSGFLARWKKCRSTKVRFLKSSAVWLDVELRARELQAGAERYEANMLERARLQPPKAPKEKKPPREKPAPKRPRAAPGDAPRAPRPKPKKKQLVTYSAQDALDNLIIAANLTKNQYDIMRECAHQINCFIYPSFASIQKVMRERAAAGMALPSVESDPDSEGEVLDSDD